MANIVIPDKMMAVVTTGNGGYEKLDYRSVDVPMLQKGQVLLRVLAAGMNNTEINTRLGWYSSSVSSSTDALGYEQEQAQAHKQDGGWNEVTPFPIIQGTDCCGEVVQVHDSSDSHLISKRVLVPSLALMQRRRRCYSARIAKLVIRCLSQGHLAVLAQQRFNWLSVEAHMSVP